MRRDRSREVRPRPAIVRCIRYAAALALACVGAAAAASVASAGNASRPVSAGSSFSLVRPIAVFGADDRAFLPAGMTALSKSIGLLYEDRSHSVCTAFCAGDDVIATAGHCLFRTEGERPLRLTGIRFRLQPEGATVASSRIAGSAQNGEAQHIAAGSRALRVKPPIDAAQDWALIRLERPICRGHALPISRQPTSELLKLSAAQRVYQVSYHRDFGAWDLALGRPCPIRRSFKGADWRAIEKDFTDAAHVILHTCDTGGASSGSPLLIDGPNGPEVIGINVGTYLQSRVLTQRGEVVHRYKSETVANTAVGAAAFRPALEALAHADIISTRTGMLSLQQLLASEGLYEGKIDGIYGPRLNTAVRAFERNEGRRETGLATAALMKRLAARAAERRSTLSSRHHHPQMETGSVGSHTVSRDRARLPR